MKLDHAGRFAMLPRSLLELPGRRPLDVACSDGTLWLTLDNDPRDFVLERGERVRIEANQRVLAYAFDAAVMEVEEVREPAIAWRKMLVPRFAAA
jgi:hypothetical protein